MTGINPSTSDNSYTFEDGRTIIVRTSFHDYVDCNGFVVHKRLVNRELVADEGAFTSEEIQAFAKRLGWTKE